MSGKNPIIERKPTITESVFMACHSNNCAQKSINYKYNEL